MDIKQSEAIWNSLAPHVMDLTGNDPTEWPKQLRNVLVNKALADAHAQQDALMKALKRTTQELMSFGGPDREVHKIVIKNGELMNKVMTSR